MIKAIITDIEGTTSSLSFVKDVLFPYAREHLADFVYKHQAEDDIKSILDDVRREVGANLSEQKLIEQLLEWLDKDAKITPLKSLQGLIWDAGYRQGHFQGHIYEDAVRSLKKFNQQGYLLYVYSSGSIYAQKLLFGHSDYGDLTSLFSGFFDTNIGGKKESLSYQRIAEKIDISPGEILFLSDVKEELDAARLAGFETYWLVRGQTIDTQAEHSQITSFDEINL